MAEFKTLPLSRITISTRLRDIDEDLAKVISGSIAEYGLMNPISVRATPRAKAGSYTLIAGLHRLRATDLLGLETIDCFVLKADQSDAQLLEIAENLHRNELSVIDRAVAVLKYRELWEERHGQISAGRPSANKSGQDVPISHSFSKYTAMRLGLHPKTIKRLSQIALNLHADLRAAVKGTEIADNQSALLKLSRLEPVKQKQAAVAFTQEPDLKMVLTAIDDGPKPKRPDQQARVFSDLINAWQRAGTETRQRFCDYIVRANQPPAMEAAE
ncbi:MAG: ParB N-terminal domain-containing protein [Hyphomicrobiales bacterium]